MRPLRANERIRAAQVRVIGNDGGQLGVMAPSDALKIAREGGLDLVEVPMLPAELVGVDASLWFRSLLVDRGRSHGVRSGMPMISDNGLVGLVTATSDSAAKAMLVL